MRTQMMQEGQDIQEDEEARSNASEIEAVRRIASMIIWKN
jgi:hypothetical protein